MLFSPPRLRFAPWLLSAVLALGLLAGCASTPAKTPETPPATVEPVATQPTPEPAIVPPVEPTPPVAEPSVQPTPEPSPTPEPVITPEPAPIAQPEPAVPDVVVAPEPTPEPPRPAPLEASEFDSAQQAIAEAEAAEADRYSPDLMNAARQALSQAKNAATTDPDGARALLQTAAETAVQARDASLVARLQNVLDRLARASELLKAQKADGWLPDATKALEADRARAEEALKADYTTGLPAAQKVLDAMATLLKNLQARLAEVQQLQKSVVGALDEAEKADAFVWVPDQLQEASDTYFSGTSAWKKFQLDRAEKIWTQALYQAQAATAKAIRELARKQTEQLMLDTMRKLENASGKTVVDPNDNIIGPQPWNGTEQLKALKKPQSLLRSEPVAQIPTDGSVVVLGERQRITYLDEAKSAWGRGVTAMNGEDYPLANQEFLQAQKLIDAYLALAVDKLYTVRLIPDRRDSLWRISEYDNIYGSPWDWPRIWKRNQKLVQNPDLIYPGWQLIIPPQ